MWPESDKASHRRNDFVGRAEVRTVARRLQDHEFAVRHLLSHVLADCKRSNDVLTALEDQRRYRDLTEIGPVIGIERDACEFLRDVGIGSAEAVGEFFAKFRPVRIA